MMQNIPKYKKLFKKDTFSNSRFFNSIMKGITPLKSFSRATAGFFQLLKTCGDLMDGVKTTESICINEISHMLILMI